MLPFGLIEQVLRLVNLLIEGKPPAMREAEARIWFDLWWPIFSPLVSPETRAKVEELIKK